MAAPTLSANAAVPAHGGFNVAILETDVDNLSPRAQHGEEAGHIPAFRAIDASDDVLLPVEHTLISRGTTFLVLADRPPLSEGSRIQIAILVQNVLIDGDVVHQPCFHLKITPRHDLRKLIEVIDRIDIEPTIRNCVKFSTNAITILETMLMVGASNIPSLAVDTIAVVELMIHLTAIDADAMV